MCEREGEQGREKEQERDVCIQPMWKAVVAVLAQKNPAQSSPVAKVQLKRS